MNPLPAARELASFARLAARLLANPQSRRPGARSVRGRAGAGLEYLEHRDFRPGDELRYLDWRLSARRQRLIVRERQADAGGDWWICLDASSSMASFHAAKWHAAVQCSAALAYALLGLGLRVGLLAFADDIVAQTTCGRGHAQYARLARQLQHLQPQDSGAASRLTVCAQQVHAQASCFVLSDFLRADHMRQDLATLRARCVDLHALNLACAADLALPTGQHLTLVDRESGDSLDALSTAALNSRVKAAWMARCANLRAYCHSDAIQFSLSDSQVGWRQALVQHLLRGTTH